MLFVFVGITALFAVVTFGAYRARGWNVVSISMALATVALGIGSIIESLLLKIELTDEAMLVTDLRGRKRYDAAEIERIEEAKGGPPAILLRSGKWVKLPSVGSSLGNSVRAWLKQR